MATILNKKNQVEKGNRTYIIHEQDIRALNEIIEAAIQDNVVVSGKVESVLEVLAANINELVGIANPTRRNGNQLDPIQINPDVSTAQIRLQPIERDPERIAPVGSRQTVPRMKNR